MNGYFTFQGRLTINENSVVISYFNRLGPELHVYNNSRNSYRSAPDVVRKDLLF